MGDIEKQRFYLSQRRAMVEWQLARRGIRSIPVLDAFRDVAREVFVPEPYRHLAYEDSPLPIAGGQTISQPYIVAYMIEALQLNYGGRVLEVGTGSGYAAALLGEIADEVVTIERDKQLADSARAVLNKLGYDNVKVVHGDGSLGWPESAPYQGIVVAAGSPEVPLKLKEQLAVGGHLVIPVGDIGDHQSLRRITRVSEQDYHEDHLTSVRFVPLVGEAGWQESHHRHHHGRHKAFDHASSQSRPYGGTHGGTTLATTSDLIAAVAEPFDDLQSADMRNLLERIGDARVVLIGEASHGTSEFYRYRAKITQALIEQKGFDFVAVEADWPDASRIDHYVRDLQTKPAEWTAFTRFPSWMWRNEEVREFVDWLREYNLGTSHPEHRVGFYGLDLYSLFTSIDAVLAYLNDVDPEAARMARRRYGCLEPWQPDPTAYGRATVTGRYRECEEDVVSMLVDILKKRLEYSSQSDVGFLNAMQNARLIANAERYYRTLYGDDSQSWNLRDQHMFDTLQVLLSYSGPNTKAVVWEHNSHIGDASATDMKTLGQHNLGQLCRQEYGQDAYLIGFGTHTGTVAAASDWGEPMDIKQVEPSLSGSWERLCHETGMPHFQMGLRHQVPKPLRKRLHETRLERAIGVIYRPETERTSHYFKARLADQFDEYVWFDRTHAVTPLTSKTLAGAPETYPFGL